MFSMTQWRRGFPTEEGHYWFYGYLFGAPRSSLDGPPRIEQLQVIRASNAMMYIACGAFINNLDLIGFWQPNPQPDTTGLDDQLPKPPEKL